ncbi:hypothetical protein CKO28_24190 [Rhodovibrio sodomensis]|uniref:Uncharacterized protein n=1 Tax=Rhodovibrio sodomensis TaxID=1088 RepID=A0ABS1DKT2_9PROT|nr:hypothetical protein [Rhodovibrio sodomensis]MBK1671109.1 hypothetical protein [Rhodovibrio sodomensis]
MFRRYNTILLACVAALLTTIATFNVIVDPYGVWRLVDVPGFNAAKTERRDYNYLFKAVDLVRREAPVMLYGSSRAAFGLSPATTAELLGCADCAYNAALTGGHMTALTAYLDHRLEHGAPLETLLNSVPRSSDVRRIAVE